MPSAIVATAGAATANSYITMAEAEAYFANRLNSDAWEAASDVDRQRALLMACRNIERCRIRSLRRQNLAAAATAGVNYDPCLVSDAAQSLKFPRRKDVDSAGAYIVPQAVKDCQCEEALALLSGAGTSKRRRLQQDGVESINIDGLAETYRTAGAAEILTSPEARDLLAPYVERGGIIATSDNFDGERVL